MAGCITEDYRTVIKGLVGAGADTQSILNVMDIIPECAKESRVPGAEAAAKHKRSVPAAWGLEPVYIDAEGKEETFSSPSALVKFLGLPMSGTICDPEGKSCRATSAVEILRISGYTVSGNGEPKKAAEGGTKLTVIHPEQVKKKK